MSHVKNIDYTRPVTIALSRSVYEDKAVSCLKKLNFISSFYYLFQAKYLDIISFNRYNSWYANTGQLDMIVKRVVDEATAWHQKFNKPVLMSEYGADTIEGLHIVCL